MLFLFYFSFPCTPAYTYMYVYVYIYVCQIVVVGKRKFDGGHQNPGDPKRRYASGLLLGNGANTWGSQPLPQQPLGSNGEQWYTDTYAAWS